MAKQKLPRENWVKVIDGAGIERLVRPVDAREIEESAKRDAGIEPAVIDEPKVKAGNNDTEILVDDQSVEPKVDTKAKSKK